MRALHFDWASWLILLIATGACGPLSDGAAESARDALRVRVEPDGTLHSAPPVLRLRARARAAPNIDDVVLVAGEVRAGHLSQLARDEVSLALSERIVPTLRWVEGDEVVVAPQIALEPGGTYHLVLASERVSRAITVTEQDLVPLLSLVWPPEGASRDGLFVVWCGQQVLPPQSLAVKLPPEAIEGVLQTGAGELSIGAHCVHLRAAGVAGSVVPPPALLGAEGLPYARLEPAELTVDAEPRVPEPLLCPLGQLPIGEGCVAEVADDRLVVQAPRGDLLWLLSDGRQLDFVGVSSGGSLLVHPLTPGSPTELTWAMLDNTGHSSTGVVRVFTRSPMAHVVITEVHANPVGPEPEQEFVELYNDGLAPADLGDLTLVDIGGETPLPPGVVLMPGAHALIVNDFYDVDSEYDPPPAEGTLIVRVPKLGKGGLKNDGEPLKLVRRSGGVSSRFPALPKPASGLSVHRVAPRVSLGDEGGFVRAEPSPGGPYVN